MIKQEKIRKLTKNDILPMLKELRDDTLEISKSLTLPIWQEAIIS